MAGVYILSRAWFEKQASEVVGGRYDTLAMVMRSE